MNPSLPERFDPERWGIVFAPAGVVAIVAGIALANGLGILLILIGVALLAIACISRTDGFLLAGPFVGLELRRTVRKTRLHLWWGLTAGLLAIGVGVGYGFVYYDPPPRHKISFASTLVLLFVSWNLFLVVLSVVVTMLAYSIAEDRDGKRLDFLLASDLRSREIVVGKLLGRMLAGLTYPAVLLPIIILLPALFGIDPVLLVLLAVIGGVTIFSMAGLSILSSAMAATKKTGGTVLTMFIAPYMLLSFAAGALKRFPEIWFFPGTPLAPSTFSVGDACEIFNVGNPILMMQGWATTFAGPPNLNVLLRDLPAYAAFHIGFGLIGLLFAVRLLRSKSATLAEKKADDGIDVKPVPPVDERPIAWKERYFTKAVVQARRKKAWRLVSFVMIVVPCVLFLAAAVSDLNGHAKRIQELALIYPPLLVWIFSVAGSRFGLETIVRERDKDTLTSLLLSDNTPREIITGKLHGMLKIMVPSWLAVGAVTLASVLCGGLPAFGGAGLMVMLIVFGTFFILVGVHTSAKATSLEAASKAFGWKLAPAAIVPPLCILGVIVSKTLPDDDVLIGAFVIAVLLGVYAMGAWLFWRSSVKRFEKACDPAAEAGPLLSKSENAA